MSPLQRGLYRAPRFLLERAYQGFQGLVVAVFYLRSYDTVDTKMKSLRFEATTEMQNICLFVTD